ncbi:ABC transporter permease [Nonomuraea sp. NPDC049419]|uniref:ABC transporter permease n=1 Tax=Nonomuraea sp. NPDC049419 TaxID=3155772 RepID=UPI00342BF4F4
MARLVLAELVKAGANRVTWILAAIAPVFCVAWAVLIVMLSPPEEAPAPVGVYAMAQQAYVFTLILGILGMSGEFRHQTITWSFLVTPRRGPVVTAKLAAYGLIGLLVALTAAVATVVAGVALLAVKGLPVWSAEVVPALAGGVLATTGYAVFGVALAVLVRSQVAAVFLAALIFTYGDYFLGWLTPGVYPWLPTGAARAVGSLPIETATLLPAWGGAVVFAGYVAVIVVIARLVTLRRDIT